MTVASPPASDGVPLDDPVDPPLEDVDPPVDEPVPLDEPDVPLDEPVPLLDPVPDDDPELPASDGPAADWEHPKCAKTTTTPATPAEVQFNFLLFTKRLMRVVLRSACFSTKRARERPWHKTHCSRMFPLT
jgi:hypothetical protein